MKGQTSILHLIVFAAVIVGAAAILIIFVQGGQADLKSFRIDQMGYAECQTKKYQQQDLPEDCSKYDLRDPGEVQGQNGDSNAATTTIYASCPSSAHPDFNDKGIAERWLKYSGLTDEEKKKLTGASEDWVHRSCKEGEDFYRLKNCGQNKNTDIMGFRGWGFIVDRPICPTEGVYGYYDKQHGERKYMFMMMDSAEWGYSERPSKNVSWKVSNSSGIISTGIRVYSDYEGSGPWNQDHAAWRFLKLDKLPEGEVTFRADYSRCKDYESTSASNPTSGRAKLTQGSRSDSTCVDYTSRKTMCATFEVKEDSMSKTGDSCENGNNLGKHVTLEYEENSEGKPWYQFKIRHRAGKVYEDVDWRLVAAEKYYEYGYQNVMSKQVNTSVVGAGKLEPDQNKHRIGHYGRALPKNTEFTIAFGPEFAYCGTFILDENGMPRRVNNECKHTP